MRDRILREGERKKEWRRNKEKTKGGEREFRKKVKRKGSGGR